VLMAAHCVAPALDWIAEADEAELRDCEGVPDAPGEFAGRVPLAIREDGEELLDLGQGAGDAASATGADRHKLLLFHMVELVRKE